MRARGRRARGALAVALALAAAAGLSVARAPGPGAARAGAATTTGVATIPLQMRVPRPRITWAPVPFGAARRRQTAAYARRHYGVATWHIRGPHVIVLHYAATESLAAVRAAFASDAPDPELGELPGTCAHFVVARDGRIYELVRPTVICRHTVGLNWTAIGVEHVGTSDAEVLADRAQRAASLRLTLWLMQRHGIRLRDVIGHAESLRSPYHRERYRSWRCQTHGDWSHPDMVRYRRLLRAEARRAGAAELAPAAEVRGPTGSTRGC